MSALSEILDLFQILLKEQLKEKSEILDLYEILLKEQLKEKSEKQIPQRNDQSHRRKCEF